MQDTRKPPLVRARFIIPALLKFRDADGDVADLARKHGLSPSDVLRPDALLPSPQCNALLSEASSLLGDPYLGATVGVEWATNDGAPFANAKKRATNLGHLLSLIAIEFSSEATTGKCELRADAEFATFVGRREYQPGATAAFGAAAFISFIVQLIKNSVGKHWNSQMVAVVAPTIDALPESLLSKSSILSGPENLFQFRFPATWLSETPNFATNDSLEATVISTKIDADLVGAVSSYLRNQIPDGDLAVSSAATAFSFSLREFQERLRAQNVTFRGLLTEVKMEYAQRELRKPETVIKELSERLGYTKVGNFSRSFKRQFGQSPSTVKKG